MSTESPKEIDIDAISERFSDYYEKNLSAEETAEMARLIDEESAVAHAYEEFLSTMSAIGGLKHVSAPSGFEHQVEDRIRRRSGGRFFGRRAFGDRIPFEIIALVILALVLGLYYLLRSSDTGSLNLFDDSSEPEIHEGARDVMPRP